MVLLLLYEEEYLVRFNFGLHLRAGSLSPDYRREERRIQIDIRPRHPLPSSGRMDFARKRHWPWN